MESSNSAKLKPVNAWCSIFAVPPPIAGDSISPEVDVLNSSNIGHRVFGKLNPGHACRVRE